MSDTLPRVGSALIVRDEANRILLGKRNKDPLRGSWVLPGGKIRAFESIAQAAARELEEETGLKVEVQRQFGVYEVINPPDEHRIIIYSWARVLGGTPKASDDLAEVRFASLRELGDLPTTPLVRKVLEDAGFLRGETERLPHEPAQPNLLLFPILIAGAVGRSPSGRPGGARRRARRKRALINAPLLFDDHVTG